MLHLTLRVLIIVFLAGSTAAQSHCRKLDGYWETREHNRDSSLLFRQENIISQSFYFGRKHKLCRTIVLRNQDSRFDTLQYLSAYSQSFGGRILRISNRNQVLRNSANLKAVDRFQSGLHFTSDTSFILLNNLYFRQNAGTPFYLIPPPKNYFRFYLQNLQNPARIVRIRDKKIQLQVDETGMPGEHLSRLTTTECILDSICGDSVSVTLLSEETEVEHRNKFVSLSTNYYAGSFNKVSKKIALKDVLYINMRNQFRRNLYNCGSVIMGASILAIVSSPFFGLNLKGDARAEARNRVFTAGVTGFAISLPFFIVGKNRKYGLSPAFKTGNRNYWQLLQK